MKHPIKPRASRAAIFERLRRLVGSDAERNVQTIVDLLDKGDTSVGIAELKAINDQIGGYCGMPNEWSKPDGAYRPLGYVPMFLDGRHSRNMSRYIIDAIGQHLENLRQRISRLGILNRISEDLFPMGRLVSSLRPFMPQQLCEDLQWFASEVFNHAKHSLAVTHGSTLEEREHYFQLNEAIAIYLIGRRLAVQLEQWSGKSKAQLMA